MKIEASNFSIANKVPRHVGYLSCSHHMNEVDAGLSCLVSLMELYCGGNNVEGVREVGHLRGLLKLIILDLTGNPVAAHDDYRLYTIYHLRKLKVMLHGMQFSFYFISFFSFFYSMSYSLQCKLWRDKTYPARC